MPEQPYLYDRTESRNTIAFPYSDFNPRAAQQAQYAASQDRAERTKTVAQYDGRPLINFNQHPDSYMIVNNPAVAYDPMPKSTKKIVVGMRWIQFAFRLLQELGALGILVCVICLKMRSDGPGYIARITPAWDVVVTTYAIYHLLRPAKGRTPLSSASYHFFALFMDTGLVPLYVCVSLYANQNYNLRPTDENRWTSFFAATFATTTVIHVTFITSIAMGALHCVSVCIDLFLVLVFRKIARLPPDMNPLETNLTGSSRHRSQKHKHKNSEMTVSSVSTHDLSERKPGYMSGSTLDVNSSSLHSPKSPEARTIPWSHSRTNSDNTYSPHNPTSARLSHQEQDGKDEGISIHQGPYSARSSRVSVSGDDYRSRAGTVITGQEAVMDYGEIPPVPAAYTDRPNSVRPKSTHGTQERQTFAAPRGMLKSQQKGGLLNDTWYVLDHQDVSDRGSPHRKAPRGATAATPDLREPTLPNVELERTDSFEPQPLKMNPPTPPPVSDLQDFAPRTGHGDHETVDVGVARRGTVASHGTVASSIYSESAPSLKSSTTPKGKYYGDLASATQNIRGSNSKPHENRMPPALGGYGMPTPQSSRTSSPSKTQPTRVISRTGAEIADFALGHENPSRRRDVSGKIVEEGRGGGGW